MALEEITMLLLMALNKIVFAYDPQRNRAVVVVVVMALNKNTENATDKSRNL